MTNKEVLSLAYQKQAAGDDRSLAEIIAQVQSDALTLEPTPNPTDVVGKSHLVFPDGRVEDKEILADGTENIT